MFDEHKSDPVPHLAAESHVDRSIVDPGRLPPDQRARHLHAAGGGAGLPGAGGRRIASRVRFLHVSTDEVYGSLAPDDPPFTESTPYAPRAPTPRARRRAIIWCARGSRTYGMPVLITNSCEQLRPLPVPREADSADDLNALEGKPLPVYGDGSNVRDWLHVEDHARALHLVLHPGRDRPQVTISAADRRTPEPGGRGTQPPPIWLTAWRRPRAGRRARE